jgi:hypothetical protein
MKSQIGLLLRQYSTYKKGICACWIGFASGVEKLTRVIYRPAPLALEASIELMEIISPHLLNELDVFHSWNMYKTAFKEWVGRFSQNSGVPISTRFNDRGVAIVFRVHVNYILTSEVWEKWGHFWTSLWYVYTICKLHVGIWPCLDIKWNTVTCWATSSYYIITQRHKPFWFLPEVWSLLQANVHLCGIFCLP